MPSPKQSFIIWFSPRSSSTLLCRSLEDTGICGKAGEFFNDQGEQMLHEFYQVSDFEELCK